MMSNSPYRCCPNPPGTTFPNAGVDSGGSFRTPSRLPAGPSLLDTAISRNSIRRATSPTSFRQTGTKTTEFGRGDFDAALIDWEKVLAEARQGIPAARDLINQFGIGGSFGEGRRSESRRLIGEGVGRDTATAVALGASSTFAARGLNTLAGAQLAEAFSNIDDERARLEIASFSPYTAMINTLANIGINRPTPSQFIDRITTPTFGRV